MDASVEALEALPGVEVHHRDEASGRIVVTQEGETVDDEVNGLRRIKSLPNVILAEMVYHYLEQDREVIENVTEVPEDEGKGCVPPFLED
jgi:nitrate reductase NapD